MQTASSLTRFLYFSLFFCGIFGGSAIFSETVGAIESTAQISWTIMPTTNIKDSRVSKFTEELIDSKDPDKTDIQVEIVCIPANAKGTLDQIEFVGSPARFNGLAERTWRLRMQADGYRDLNFDFTIKPNARYRIEVELEQVVGALKIVADQSIQVLNIDGTSRDLAGGPFLLKAGFHKILARSFTYQDYEQSVLVRENQLTNIELHYVIAPFKVSTPWLTRSSFRPGNSGSLGTTDLQFEVSSRGHGTVTIVDTNNNVVRELELGNFVTWGQHANWNGRDNEGNLLPEGSYTWNLSAEPDDDIPGEAVSLQGKVSIDNSNYIKFRGLFSGSPGLELVSDAYTLAPGSFQFSTRGAFQFSDSANASVNSPRALLGLGVRVGIMKGLEINANSSAETNLDGTSQARGLFGGGINWAFLPLPGRSVDSESVDFGCALNAGGAAMLATDQMYPIDLRSTGILSGGRVGVAAQFRFGRYSLLLEPVVHVSPWLPYLSGSGSTVAASLPATALHFFGSIRSGFYWDNENVLIGASVAIWTGENFIPTLPVEISIQGDMMIFEGFTLGIHATSFVDTTGVHAPGFGITLGLIQ